MKPKIGFCTIVANREYSVRFLGKSEGCFVYGYLLKHAPNNSLTIFVHC